MKIFVDAHIFDQGYEGSRTYLEGLYCRMIEEAPQHNYIFGGYDTGNLKTIFGEHPNVGYVKYRFANRFIRLALEIPFILLRIRPDYSHFQYISPLIKFSREIVTIHDVLFIDYPHFFPGMYRKIRSKLFKRSVRRADMILTVSEYSRGRIACTMPVGRKRVYVVPNGIHGRFLKAQMGDFESIKGKYGLDKYVLCVGRFEPRKNQVLLLKSFVELELYAKGYELVFIGKESLRYTEFVRYLSSQPDHIIDSVKILENIPDIEMPLFYKACRVFVYPSHAEGFGIPPLEAIASNIPVIISDNTALSDFRSLNPIYFDSDNLKNLNELLDRTLRSDYPLSKPVDMSEYGWEKSAKQFSSLLNTEVGFNSGKAEVKVENKRIAIVGTRGIPSSYGGFETFAEELSSNLAERGGDIYVYCEKSEERREKYRGVNLWHAGFKKSGNQLRYYFCGLRWASRFADIVINAGTGGAIFYYLFKSPSSILITNMDGLEHKRDKWSFWVKWFLNLSEHLSVRISDYVVADSIEIARYLTDKYPQYINKIRVISYGANPVANQNVTVLSDFGLTKDRYFLVVARLEPENNISMIIDGFLKSESDCKLVIVGPVKKGSYCKTLLSYRSDRVIFTGGIFDKTILAALRYNAKAYLHGHSVGGTNPSLLESMAQGTLSICHDNVFNREVTSNNQFYFKDVESLGEALLTVDKLERESIARLKKSNLKRIEEAYSWDMVADQYMSLFNEG